MSGSTRRCPDFARILREASPDDAVREQVARCFSTEMRRFARFRCRDDAKGEDAAQDAMLVALQGLDRFRGESDIRTWLHKLVVSACARLRRGRKNDPAYNRPMEEVGAAASADAGPDAQAMLRERLELLGEALEELPEPSRSLLLLFEGQGCSQADLAERFGLTEGAVKARLKRARQRLRARLLELAEEEVGG